MAAVNFTSATLGGQALLAEQPLGWQLTQGTAPYQRVFLLERIAGLNLLKRFGGVGTGAGAPSEVDLVLKLDDGTAITVSGLTILQQYPADKPWLIGLLVSDRRWKWNRKHVLQRHNVRRRSGDFHLVDAAVRVAADPQPDVRYAKYSLFNETSAWTPKQVVESVLGQVTDGQYTSADLKLEDLSSLAVEGLELDDPGDTAIDRALALFPGLQVYLDYSGVARLTYDKGMGEGDIVLGSGPPVVGPPLVAPVDMAGVRPASITVLFTPEYEVRFDFHEPASTATGSHPEPDLITGNTLDNVLRSPDRRLALKLGGTTQTVVQNTWVPIDDTLTSAWNTDSAASVLGIPLDPLDLATYRKLCLNGGYNIYPKALGSDLVDPIWARRLATLRANYRRTFRINRRWMDRLRSFRAYRVAIVDTVNGTRAPADVFCDTTIVPTACALAKTAGGALAMQLGYSTKGWAAAIDTDDTISPAPTARVAVEDEEAGVFRVDFARDVMLEYYEIWPGKVTAITGEPLSSTTLDPRLTDRGLGLLKDLQFTSTFDLAVILTVVPASPNSTAQLYSITVTPEQARAVLPPALRQLVGECRGPAMTTRIGPGVATARFAWQDAAAQDFQNAILGTVTQAPPGFVQPKGVAGALAVSEQRLVDPDWLKSLARSIAAAYYLLMADHLEGSHTVKLFGAAPKGRIQTVSHELDPSGRALTTLHLPANLRTGSVDPMALLPESIRRKLLGLVQP